MEDEVAVAVGERDFERGLGEKSGAPAGVFLRRGGRRRIERGHFRQRVRGGGFVARRELAAPIQRLQLPPLVDAKHVGHVAAIEPKHLPDARRRGVGSRRKRERNESHRYDRDSKQRRERNFHGA
jgi:hypothetical protein